MKAELITKNHLVTRLPRRGSGLMEVIIAVAILALGLSSAILLAFANQSLKISSVTNNEALGKAEGLIEKARADARKDFYSLASLAPFADDIYTNQLDVVEIDIFNKEVTSRVSWTGEHGQPLFIDLITHLTDPASAAGGDTCSPLLVGDWTAPQDYTSGYGYYDFISPNGTSGVDAFNKKAYLTSDITGKDNFYIIDVSNPKPPPSINPKLPKLGSLEADYALTDVRVAGQFAFVTTMSQLYELFVIDISDPTNLDYSHIVKKFDVKSPGFTGYGNTIFYSKKKLYVGMTKSTGHEFYVVDVSDPLSPVVEDSFETGTSINQIIVKDDLAYLAGALDNQVWIVDVSDPTDIYQTNPAQQTFVDPSGTQDWSGQSIALSGTDLYLGRIYDVGDNGPELYVLDADDLSQPPVDSLTQTKQDGVSRMVIRENLIFMSNTKHNDGFQIWDRNTLTRHDITPLNVEESSTSGMDCEGNYIYLGERSGRALQIIGPS